MTSRPDQICISRSVWHRPGNTYLIRPWGHRLCHTFSGEWIELIDYSSFFQREKTSMATCMLFCTSSPFRKRVYSKRKEFVPKEGKLFFNRQVHVYKSYPDEGLMTKILNTMLNHFWFDPLDKAASLASIYDVQALKFNFMAKSICVNMSRQKDTLLNKPS